MPSFKIDSVFRAIDRFTQPVAKMRKGMARFSGQIKRSLRAVGSLQGKMIRGLKTAALAVAGAVTAAAIAIKKMANRADELAKRSTRLDFPVEDLQKWQFVAQQAGLTTAAFDKNLEGFTRRLGEAKVGTGVMATVVKRLDPVLFRQIKATSGSAEALQVYLKALGKVKDPAKRAALANAAFGRSGMGMINVALLGEEAIGRLMSEMEQNGIITTAQAKNAEKFNDTLNSTKLAFMGVLQGALLPLLPKLTDLAEKTRAWVLANRDLIGSRVREFFDKLRENLPKIIRFLKILGTIWATVFVVSSVANGILAFLKLKAAVLGAIPTVKALFALLMAHPFIAIAAAVIGLGILIVRNWDTISATFKGIWDEWQTIVDTAIENMLGKIQRIIDTVRGGFNAVKSFFGLETSPSDDIPISSNGPIGFNPNDPNIVGGAERISRSISETTTRDTAEVTIRDTTGRAEMTSKPRGNSVSLARSGGF